MIAKKRKAKGKRVLEDVEASERPGGANVIDLMAALKQSLGAKANGAARARKPTGKAGKAAASPIDKTRKPAAKTSATRGRAGK